MSTIEQRPWWSCAGSFFPRALSAVQGVRSPRKPVSEVRTSFTRKSRKREDEEKNEPVEEQRHSFVAAGTESEAVNHAEYAGGDRPPAPEHGLCDWGQPLRSDLAPHFLPAGIPKIRPDPGPGEQREEERGDRTDGTDPPRNGSKNYGSENNWENI